MTKPHEWISHLPSSKQYDSVAFLETECLPWSPPGNLWLFWRFRASAHFLSGLVKDKPDFVCLADLPRAFPTEAQVNSDVPNLTAGVALNLEHGLAGKEQTRAPFKKKELHKRVPSLLDTHCAPLRSHPPSRV